MKKILTYAAVIGLAIPASFAVPAPARAGHIPELCKYIVYQSGGDFSAEGFDFHFDSFGQCVSWANTEEARSFAFICKSIVASGGLDYFGFKNFGECVAKLGT
ncbi:hypothetical protein N0B51_09825 [Tsuneonella sp. YG55]|uniref:YARHG domain-containing protein n=1 Tax=Tsuneonella litorea TaxID=2976475 RepID=A0A9X2W1Z6_9SPHN|nr:hypothetical protein [Tsuneonella litorea]MCT2559282.1 hypothetical protein [Tsuneonella litorea]